MRLRLFIAPVLTTAVLAVLLPAPPASAQPKPDAGKPNAAKPPPKPDAAKADAVKDPVKEEAAKVLAKQAEARLADLVKRGTEACERGETDEGLALLTAAVARRNDADVLGALASCEAKAGQWAAAADHYAAALRSKEEGADRKPLEEAFAEARKKVGSITITVNVDGADVIVDDRLVGQSPLPGEIFVTPGKDTSIVVKRTGYEEAEKRVQVAAQRTAAVKIELAQSTSTGNRYAAANRTKVPFYVLGGAALVAGGVGAALYAASFAHGSAADNLLTELKTAHPTSGDTPCQPSKTGCATLLDLRKNHDKLMNVGTGFLIGGGALLGAAVITGLWAFSGSSATSTTGRAITGSPRAASITFAPVVSPDGAGLWMRGAF